MVEMTRALIAAAFVAGALAALLGWLWLAERIAARLPRRSRRAVLGWLWLTPAVLLVGTYLAWPLVNTVYLSLRDPRSLAWRGLGGWLSDITLSSNLRFLPHWAAGPMVLLMILGWAGWRSHAGSFCGWRMWKAATSSSPIWASALPTANSTSARRFSPAP